MPRHVGQVPIHHAQKWGSGYRRTTDDIHHGYLDMPSTPLFPFGHGLSYTTFEYSPLTLEKDMVDVSGEAKVSITMKNTGNRRGVEVVQLYAADTATGVTLPAQQLVGFARVDLEPGQAKTVGFVVPLSVLAYTGVSGDLMMEPGPVETECRQQFQRYPVHGDLHRHRNDTNHQGRGSRVLFRGDRRLARASEWRL